MSSYTDRYKLPGGKLNIAEIKKHFLEQGNTVSTFGQLEKKGPAQNQNRANLQNSFVFNKPLNIIAKMNEYAENKENKALYATPEKTKAQPHSSNALPTPLRAVNTSLWKTNINLNDDSVLEINDSDSWSNVGDTTFERQERECEKTFYPKEEKVDEETEALDRLMQEFGIEEEKRVPNNETQLMDVEAPSFMWDQSISNNQISPMKMVGLLRPSTIMEEDTMDNESQLSASAYDSAKGAPSEASLFTEFLSQKAESDYDSDKSTEYQSVSKESNESFTTNEPEHKVATEEDMKLTYEDDSLEKDPENYLLEDFEPDSLMESKYASVAGNSVANSFNSTSRKQSIGENKSFGGNKDNSTSNADIMSQGNKSVEETNIVKSDSIKEDTINLDESPKRSHHNVSCNESQKTPVNASHPSNGSIQSEQTGSETFLTADEDAARTENFVTADESTNSSMSAEIFPHKKHTFYNKEFMDSISADASSSSIHLNTSHKNVLARKFNTTNSSFSTRKTTESTTSPGNDDALDITNDTHAEESEVIEVMDDSVAGTLDGVDSLASDSRKDSLLDDSVEVSHENAGCVSKSSMDFNDSLERMEYMMEKGARIMIERGENVAFHQSVMAEMKRTPKTPHDAHLVASPKTPNTVIPNRGNNSPYNFRSIDRTYAKNSPRLFPKEDCASPNAARSLNYTDVDNSTSRIDLDASIELHKTPRKIVSQNTFVVTNKSSKQDNLPKSPRINSVSSPRARTVASPRVKAAASPRVKAVASPRTPNLLQQKNVNSPQRFPRECKTVEFKKPSKIPMPRSVQQLKRPQFENVASPIGEYIKHTAQLPLATNTKSCRNDLFGQMREWELDVTLDEQPLGAVPENYVALLPRKAFISAENRQILDQRNTPIIPGGNKMHMLIDHNTPTVVRHEGRLHTPNHANRQRGQMNDSFGDLSMLDGDISVQVVKSAHRN